MISSNENKGGSVFHLLALTQGKWGKRIAANITDHAPSHWVVHTWKAPIDHDASLPPRLTQQVTEWLDPMGVEIIFPKPFCSLTESTYNQEPIRKSNNNEIIREFANDYRRLTFDLFVKDDSHQGTEVIRYAGHECVNEVAGNCP